jgi:hypothetical protein
MLLAGALVPLAQAQGSGALSLGEIHPVAADRGATAKVTLTMYVRTGFHVNSDKPNDDYLIPLKLTWDKGPLEVESIDYPAPQIEKTSFSDKLSVFSGSFRVTTNFRVPPDAPLGSGMMTGKLRYQACDDHQCLRPQTVEIRVPVEIR